MLFPLLSAVIIAVSEFFLIKLFMENSPKRDVTTLTKHIRTTCLVFATLIFVYTYIWVLPQEDVVFMEGEPLLWFVTANLAVFFLVTINPLRNLKAVRSHCVQ